MIEPPIDERYEMAAVKQSLTTDERNLAEQAYTLLAHDYEANPIGSRDWVLFWTGWRNRAELSLATTANSRQPSTAADIKDGGK